MNIQEVIDLIKIGFEKPKHYKRSVWNKATKVMEFLADNTNGEVIRTYLGSGLEKYKTEATLTDAKLIAWATAYNKNNNI